MILPYINSVPAIPSVRTIQSLTELICSLDINRELEQILRQPIMISEKLSQVRVLLEKCPSGCESILYVYRALMELEALQHYVDLVVNSCGSNSLFVTLTTYDRSYPDSYILQSNQTLFHHVAQKLLRAHTGNGLEGVVALEKHDKCGVVVPMHSHSILSAPSGYERFVDEESLQLALEGQVLPDVQRTFNSGGKTRTITTSRIRDDRYRPIFDTVNVRRVCDESKEELANYMIKNIFHKDALLLNDVPVFGLYGCANGRLVRLS